MDNVKTFKRLVIISIIIELAYLLSIFFEPSVGEIANDVSDSAYILGEAAESQSAEENLEDFDLNTLIAIAFGLAFIPLYILALFLLYKFSRLGRGLYIILSVGTIPLMFLMPINDMVSSYIDLLYYILGYTIFGAIVATIVLAVVLSVVCAVVAVEIA